MDQVIHEPARLLIMSVLSGVETVDFAVLLQTTGLTKGNLSSHVARLERVGYVEVLKSFRDKIPHTDYRLTPNGRDALVKYWQELDEIKKRYRPAGENNA